MDQEDTRDLKAEKGKCQGIQAFLFFGLGLVFLLWGVILQEHGISGGALDTVLVIGCLGSFFIAVLQIWRSMLYSLESVFEVETGWNRSKKQENTEERNQMKWEPADIVIHIQGKGIVLREKSLVAFEITTGKVLAVGTEAEALADKESENICVMSPLRQGMVADYTVAERMFAYMMAKARGKRFAIRKPAISVCVPQGITEIEKKALSDALIQAGAKEMIFYVMPMEQFFRESEQFPDINKKYKITIGITKEEPERYVSEELNSILQYAAREGISRDRVAELLQAASGSEIILPSSH